MTTTTKLPVAPNTSPDTSRRTLRVRSQVRAGSVRVTFITQTQTGGIIR